MTEQERGRVLLPKLKTLAKRTGKILCSSFDMFRFTIKDCETFVSIEVEDTSNREVCFWVSKSTGDFEVHDPLNLIQRLETDPKDYDIFRESILGFLKLDICSCVEGITCLVDNEVKPEYIETPVGDNLYKVQVFNLNI